MAVAKGPLDHRPDVRLAWALGIVVVAAAIAPVAIALVFGDRLPAEVPRHYGADGRPTALWPRWTSVTFTSVATLLVAGGTAAACVLVRLSLMARRVTAWTATWVASLLGGLQAGALIGLLDTTDPLASGSLGRTTTWSLLAGLIIGIPVAALAREEPHGRPAVGPPPAHLDRLPDGAATRWRSEPLSSRTLIVRFVHVPIAAVAQADVVEHLDLFWEVGGWGLRVDVHGRTGNASRAGEALRLVRGDDSELVLTVDDAATAAATLDTLADRHRTDRHHTGR
jgi:hypothetical protein